MTKEQRAIEALTPKQREVLEGLHKKEHPAQIAKHLKISTNGVYQHMRRIREAGIDFPLVMRKRGRPKGSGKKKPPTPTERIGVVDGEPSAAPVIGGGEPVEVSIEESIAEEIRNGDERVGIIEASTVALSEEREKLEARLGKLKAAHAALAA
jgi:biotin operon repressor